MAYGVGSQTIIPLKYSAVSRAQLPAYKEEGAYTCYQVSFLCPLILFLTGGTVTLLKRLIGVDGPLQVIGILIFPIG